MTTADGESLFEQRWQPAAYLATYYPQGEVTPDEAAILAYLVAHLRQAGRRYATAIEIGCGPTIHHALPAIPYVDQIELADIVPANLAAVQAWLDAAPEAYDWDHYVRRVLELEQPEQPIAPQALTERKAQLRSTIATLRHVDLRQPQPLGAALTYDLVLSFYCADSATSSKAEWRRYMRNLLTLVAPGGTVVVSALRRAQFYTVADDRFPSAQVDEADLADVFAAAGFATEDTEIQVVEVATWEDFSSVLIASARSRLAR